MSPERDPTAPATHALVVGISRYDHIDGGSAPTADGSAFGLRQLTAAARSASQVAHWLSTNYHNPKAPLGSLRLCLSPAPDEVLVGDGTQAQRATHANVTRALREFAADCARHGDNVGIVYVAGHGVQLTKHGAIVLCEDFGHPDQVAMLERAIDMAGWRASMDHGGQAKHQLWLVDACRQPPPVAREFERMTPPVSPDERHGATEASWQFLASATREAAFAIPNVGTLFSRALLWALSGGAAVGGDPSDSSWHVSASRLGEVIQARVRELTAGKHRGQTVEVSGRIAPVTIHHFPEPPEVDIELNLPTGVSPPLPSASLLLDATQPVVANHTVWPLVMRVPAGLYLLQLIPPWSSPKPILRFRPPRTDQELLLARESTP